MKALKTGDIIIANGIKEEVRAVLGNIIFTRKIFEDGSKSPTDFHELEDLIAYGYSVDL